MQTIKLIIINASICIMVLAAGITFADEWRDTRDGIRSYESANFGRAEELFLRVKEKLPENAFAISNAGAAEYKQNKYGAAAKEFSASLALHPESQDTVMIADNIYNIGNCAFRIDSLQKAAELYRSCLSLDENNLEAKYNLELVTRKSQSKSDSQSSRNNKEQSNKQKKGQQQEEEKKQEQKDEQKQGSKSNQQNEERQNDSQMSKLEALKLMEAMEHQEQDLLKEWIKQEQREVSGENGNLYKDW